MESSDRPATFQLNTFRDTGSVTTLETRILSLQQAVSTRILLAITVFAPSRRQRTIQTIHGVVSHSGIFPRFFLDRLLELSLFASTSLSSLWASNIQPAISSAEPSRVHQASLFEADPLKKASSCYSRIRISSVFSGDMKWLLFLSIDSPSLSRSSERILISS